MTATQLSRRQLALAAFVRFSAGALILLAMLLLPAGTVAYWEAWVYLAVLFIPMMGVLCYLLAYDPQLLAHRLLMKEKEPEQALIVKLGLVCYVLTFLLPGFDHRFGWSDVPASAVLAADVVVLLGYVLFVLVLRVNSYASRVVVVQQGQRVATTGPYRVVRHPMYLAILVMFFFTPVALGSWWALIPAVPLAGVMAARIRNEEQLLIRELEGYEQYVQATRYRLIPGVW